MPIRLPTPTVRFSPDFESRLARLVLRVSSQRERREGAGRAALVGAGTEFVGYRRYRAGEDLRRLDWSLYARTRKPFVRVSRREASERWAVLVDTSASMGLGRPGKLQRAAEIATGIAAIGHKEGARVELFLSGSRRTLSLARHGHLREWMRALEDVRAHGDEGLAALVAEPARFREAGAVFLVGDLLDLEPRQALALARRGRGLFLAQLLAPEELTPTPGGPVRWIDAETGKARSVELDQETVGAYERLLSSRLEAWRGACARHRVRYGSYSTRTEFEGPLRAMFED